jgi:hypothetical protein
MMIDDGKLNKKQNYFFQIQGQLFVTKRKYCDFIVWTPKGINVEIIVADDQFMKNILPKLKDFYYKHYGPELVDSRHERNMKLRDTIVYYIMRRKNEVLCAAAGRLAAERSEADKPAKAHKTIFAPNNIYYFFFKPS